MLAIIAFPAALYAEKTTDVNTGGEPGDGCESLGINVERECSALKGPPMHGEAVVSSIDEINTAQIASRFFPCRIGNVKTAARLESYGKENFKPVYLNAPCRILAGDPTARLLDENIEAHLVDEGRLKEKIELTRIYHVRGRKKRAARAPLNPG